MFHNITFVAKWLLYATLFTYLSGYTFTFQQSDKEEKDTISRNDCKYAELKIIQTIFKTRERPFLECVQIWK